jgi:hypothetical protein
VSFLACSLSWEGDLRTECETLEVVWPTDCGEFCWIHKDGGSVENFGDGRLGSVDSCHIQSV